MNSRIDMTLRRTLLALVAVDLVLIFLTVALYPSVISASRQGLLTAGLPLAGLLVYAALALAGTVPTDATGAHARKLGLIFGLAIGLGWAVEVVLTNLVFLDANSNNTMATVTYLVLVILYLAAGVAGAATTARFRGGLVAGLWSGLISAPLAVAAGLIVNLVFMQNLAQHPLLLQDFVRSGMTNLPAFLLQDTLGGCFIHLTLLGPLLGALFGALGALAGLAFARRDRR
jgi:hypothetical protein